MKTKSCRRRKGDIEGKRDEKLGSWRGQDAKRKLDGLGKIAGGSTLERDIEEVTRELETVGR